MSFYLSKILWLIINPLNIILLFIFSGIVVKIIFKNTLHKLFYFVAFIFFIIVAVIPTGEFMFYQLEKKFHTQSVLPSQVNGILILSGATIPQLTHEHNKIHLNGSVERLTESISLMQRYPNAKIIFAGGSGSIFNQELTHADVARNFFEQLNINTEKIIFESRNLKYCVVCNFPITKDRLDAFSETNICSAKCVELQEEVFKKTAEPWPQPPDDKKICKFYIIREKFRFYAR